MRDGMGRRALMRDTIRLTAAAAAAHVGLRFAPALSAAQRGAAPADAAASGTTLVLLGTQGGPNVNLARSQAANAVLVQGRPYLIDCGYGALRALVQAGIPYNDITSVFLTHLHDDHTTDVAALLSHKWTGGRAQATTVHGPAGTRTFIEAAVAYLGANAEIRIVDEGREQRPGDLFRGVELSVASGPAQVFRDDRVTVRAVENTHYPERARNRMPYRSLAYRFDTASRSIVFSGDTAYSKGLVALAQNADLFVCEAMDVALHAQLSRAAEAEEAKTGNQNSVARHIVETHSTTEDVGRMASDANVKTVVLTHLLPGSNPLRGGDLPDTTYIDAVRRFFTGQVIVGRDQMRL